MGVRKIAFTLMLNGFHEVVDEIYTHAPTSSPPRSARIRHWCVAPRCNSPFWRFYYCYSCMPVFLQTIPIPSWLGLKIFLGIIGDSLVAFVFVRPFKVTFEHDPMLVKAVLAREKFSATPFWMRA